MRAYNLLPDRWISFSRWPPFFPFIYIHPPLPPRHPLPPSPRHPPPTPGLPQRPRRHSPFSFPLKFREIRGKALIEFQRFSSDSPAGGSSKSVFPSAKSDPPIPLHRPLVPPPPAIESHARLSSVVSRVAYTWWSLKLNIDSVCTRFCRLFKRGWREGGERVRSLGEESEGLSSCLPSSRFLGPSVGLLCQRLYRRPSRRCRQLGCRLREGSRSSNFRQARPNEIDPISYYQFSDIQYIQLYISTGKNYLNT